MFNMENPVRDGHWAQSNIPAFMVGRRLKTNYTPIFVGRKIVGKVQGDVFRKRVKASIHFLRIPPAISFDVVSLEQAEKAGALLVEVTDKESGGIYRASLSTIWNKGFELNRGQGCQVALPLSVWNANNEAQPIQQMKLRF